MILEIAAGVCLGIVAAVILIRYGRSILEWLLLLVIAATLIWLCVHYWPTPVKILEYALAVFAALAILSGLITILKFAWSRITRRYPSLDALDKGDPPWNRAVHVPLRLILKATLAIAVALFILGVVFSIAFLLDWTGVSNALHL